MEPISLNRNVYREKVAGCWYGKNIGGTLGAPFESTHEILDLKFYTQELQGEPEPNDDLDLQLLWLEMAERFGIEHLSSRLFGEFWLDFVTAGWNEYGIAHANMQNGFFPPLSGSLNNEKWKNSNGAWIRSELWACLCPGSPETAARFAWMDASCDHAEDGIHAEIFTAVLESMAFVQSDLRKLLDSSLAYLPENSRITRVIHLCCNLYDGNVCWKDARDRVVEANADTGFFQAPQNIGFILLGLLYGEGDFEKSLLYAVNCGDDTDCTAATVGSIMGILLGESGIPERWKTPIGRSIRTVSIDIMHNNIAIPKGIDELTERVVFLAEDFHRRDPRLPEFTDRAYERNPEFNFAVSKTYQHEILDAGLHWMSLPLGSGLLLVSYPDGAEIGPREELRIILTSNNTNLYRMDTCTIRLHLPDGWGISPGPEIFLRKSPGEAAVTLRAPDCIDDAVTQIPLEVRTRNRNYPEYAILPIQTRGAVAPDSKGTFILSDFRSRQAVRRNNI